MNTRYQELQIGAIELQIFFDEIPVGKPNPDGSQAKDVISSANFLLEDEGLTTFGYYPEEFFDDLIRAAQIAKVASQFMGGHIDLIEVAIALNELISIKKDESTEG